jgi:hypothetical protein
MTRRHHSSRACQWVEPRAHTDPSLRRMTYGPILSAEEVRSELKWGVIAVCLVGLFLGGLLLWPR